MIQLSYQRSVGKMDYPRLELLVATDKNLGIGKDNRLPWSIPSEFAYYKRMSTSPAGAAKVHASIYGRKNWESIPEKVRPWGNTICFILSRTMKMEDVSKYGADVHVHSTWDAIIEHLRQPEMRERIDRVWVHGGEAIYKMAMRSSLFYRLYWSKINASYPVDVFFPVCDENRLKRVHDPDVPQGVHHDAGVDYEVFVYESKGVSPLLEDVSKD